MKVQSGARCIFFKMISEIFDDPVTTKYFDKCHFSYKHFLRFSEKVVFLVNFSCFICKLAVFVLHPRKNEHFVYFRTTKILHGSFKKIALYPELYFIDEFIHCLWRIPMSEIGG